MYLSFTDCFKVGKIYPAHSYRESVCVSVFGFVCLCCFVSVSVLSPLLALLVCVSSVCLALVPLSSLVACGLSVCSCCCLALRPARVWFRRCLCCSCLFSRRLLVPWACRLFVLSALCLSFCLSVAPSVVFPCLVSLTLHIASFI